MTPIETLDTGSLAELGRPDPLEVADRVREALGSEAGERAKGSARFYDLNQENIDPSGYSYIIITLKGKKGEIIKKSLLPVVKRQGTNYAIDEYGFLYKTIDDEEGIKLLLWSQPTEKDYYDTREQKVIKKGTIFPLSAILANGEGHETIPLTEESEDNVFRTESHKIIADFQIMPLLLPESEFREKLVEYINKFREFYPNV